MTAQHTAAESSSAGKLLDAPWCVNHGQSSGLQHSAAQLSPTRRLRQQPRSSQQIAKGLAAAEQALDARLAQGMQPEAVQAAICVALSCIASADSSKHDLTRVRGYLGLVDLH